MEHFASLDSYLVHNTTPFENLTKFSLKLDAFRMRLTESSLPLVPFFRFLPPTLQHLNIVNLSFTLDLSVLFNFLSESACYLKLVSLELEFTFNPSFQYSCQSIRRFLLIHSNNLQLLKLHVTTRDQEHLGAWLATLTNTEFQFSSLQTLEISPSTSQTGLSAVLVLIKRTAPTLSALWIDFRALTFEETEQVIDALTEGGATAEEDPRKLKTLGIEITQLSVPFLDLLARKLPQLEELFISAGIVGSFTDLLYHRRYDPYTSSSLSTQDHLHTWKLRNFCVIVAGQLSTGVMHTVAGAVPSVVIQDGPPCEE